MKKVLLHICCGVCAFHSIERLKGEGFFVEGFFFNPNIYPHEEYVRRKEVAEKVGQLTSVKITEGKYEPEQWLNVCQIYKDEKEGGMRCRFCYEIRLNETLANAKVLGFDYFTTTLTISSHKNSKTVIDIGKDLAGDYFLALDFKKQDGFKKTMELVKKNNLYCQNYCGCVYSYTDNRR